MEKGRERWEEGVWEGVGIQGELEKEKERKRKVGREGSNSK